MALAMLMKLLVARVHENTHDMEHNTALQRISRLDCPCSKVTERNSSRSCSPAQTRGFRHVGNRATAALELKGHPGHVVFCCSQVIVAALLNPVIVQSNKEGTGVLQHELSEDNA